MGKSSTLLGAVSAKVEISSFLSSRKSHKYFDEMIKLLVFLLLVFVASASSFIWQGKSWTRYVSLFSADLATETEVSASEQVISLTEKAQNHLRKLKTGDELYLRMGVKSGGCSGMSYMMDVIEPSAISEDDLIETFDGIKCVVDPKSLLYLYGLKLDYSDELIGGGFKFTNPNAEASW